MNTEHTLRGNVTTKMHTAKTVIKWKASNCKDHESTGRRKQNYVTLKFLFYIDQTEINFLGNLRINLRDEQSMNPKVAAFVWNLVIRSRHCHFEGSQYKEAITLLVGSPHIWYNDSYQFNFRRWLWYMFKSKVLYKHIYYIKYSFWNSVFGAKCNFP